MIRMASKVALAAVGLATIGLTVASPANAQVKPDSSTGCTGDTVCITVAGTKLHVDSVSGGVAAPGGVIASKTWCGYIRVTIVYGSTRYREDYSGHGCASGFGPFNYTDNINQNFPNGSRACLTPITDSGRYNPGGSACETISS